MNYIDKLEMLNREKNDRINHENLLVSDMENELTFFARRIKDKHLPKIQAAHDEIESCNQKIDEYCKKVEEYSTFDDQVIGEVLSSIISAFEGKVYFYQDACYYTSQTEYYFFEKREFDVCKQVKIVVAESDRHTQYDDQSLGLRSINRLADRSLVLVLDEDIDPLSDKITFYQSNPVNHNLIQKVNFGKFSYVKDFIDYVISYLMKNNLKEINKEQLDKIKVNFLVFNEEEIDSRYQIDKTKRIWYNFLRR